MLRMKTIDEIRLENLEQLVAQAGGLSELVAKSNGKLSRPTLDQILKGRTTAKGTRKNIGDDLARKIEKCLKLEDGWMDNIQGGADGAAAPSPDQLNTAELVTLLALYSNSTETGRQTIMRAATLAEKARAVGDLGEVRRLIGGGH